MTFYVFSRKHQAFRTEACGLKCTNWLFYWTSSQFTFLWFSHYVLLIKLTAEPNSDWKTCVELDDSGVLGVSRVLYSHSVTPSFPTLCDSLTWPSWSRLWISCFLCQFVLLMCFPGFFMCMFFGFCRLHLVVGSLPCALWTALRVFDCLPAGSDLYLPLHHVERRVFVFNKYPNGQIGACIWLHQPHGAPPAPSGLRHYTHYFN